MEKKTVNKLVMELGKGSDAAFNELYVQLKSPLYSFIYRKGLTTEDLQDLLHDIYVEIIDRSRELTRFDNCFGWIFTIARGVAINFYNKQKHDMKYREKVAGEYAAAHGNRERDSSDKIDLEKAMENLPEETQRFVKLYYAHEYTYQMISDLSGKTVDKVQRKVRNGTKKLKKYFGITED